MKAKTAAEHLKIKVDACDCIRAAANPKTVRVIYS